MTVTWLLAGVGQHQFPHHTAMAHDIERLHQVCHGQALGHWRLDGASLRTLGQRTVRLKF
jgi:hypothetical protein